MPSANGEKIQRLRVWNSKNKRGWWEYRCVVASDVEICAAHREMWSPPGFDLWAAIIQSVRAIIHDSKDVYRSYADNTQIYALAQNDCGPRDSLCQCFQRGNSWLQFSFLQLNKDKMGVVVFGKKKERMEVIAQLDSRALKTRLRNLGVLIQIWSSYVNTITTSTIIRDLMSRQNVDTLRQGGLLSWCLLWSRS